MGHGLRTNLGNIRNRFRKPKKQGPSLGSAPSSGSLATVAKITSWSKTVSLMGNFLYFVAFVFFFFYCNLFRILQEKHYIFSGNLIFWCILGRVRLVVVAVQISISFPWRSIDILYISIFICHLVTP
ncbi:glutamine-dependent NAD(+) synthetase isoform X2 [Iris pallida]|uniref:Glutamine-dependent NAD(+) synthetase isoform X2 n=1 Tax=Iris pallida TaxID=29817 RepID=A0AAX6G5H0_IRIPA|nr:glutamine-dependent NAD(+) synthetase isoform X2 [Iris pallida]